MKTKNTKRTLSPKVKKYLKGTGIFVAVLALLYLFFFLLPLMLPFFRDHVFNVSDNNKIDVLGQMGDSYGIFNALFSGLAFLGVLITLYKQSRDNRKHTVVEEYYQMLDVQQKVLDEINVAQVRKVKQGEPIAVAEGRKAFVEFKIQMKYLVKAIKEMSERNGFKLSDIDIADIAYAVFFYGSSKSWKPFMMEYLKDYPDTERLVDAIIARLDSEKRFILYRPNQNYLSVYFRNMYNAIKLIDNCGLISSEEKKDYVKILRAQLSNAELYILFFNIISRFGKKWVDNDYVTKYQLIQNLPSKYCDGYNPKDYFPEIKFEGDELCLSPFKEQIVQREK